MSEIVSLEALRRVVTPYHLGHAALLLAYWPIRTFLASDLSALQAPASSSDSMTREQEVLGLMLAVIFIKSRRVVTLEDLLEKTFLFARCGVVALLYILSLKLALWYCVALVAAFFLLKPPRFFGEEDFEYFNSVSFESKVRSPQGQDRKTLWLVVFHADWCEKCTVTEPLFAKLSTRFSDERRRFAKVDLERYTDLAEEFSIDVSGFTKQLPTVIMFYKGRELRRLPALGKGGKPVASTLSESELVRWFELDKPVPDVIHPRAAKDTNDQAKAKE